MSIPPVIQGGSQLPPVQYGRATHATYDRYLNEAQDAFTNGDEAPLDQLNKASIRYTPDGSITKGAISQKAIDNALGYAAADIEKYDCDGDKQLSPGEVLLAFAHPAQAKLADIEAALQDPRITTAERSEAEQYRTLIIGTVCQQAANYFSSIDTVDPETGQRDNTLTADELAAKTLFDDSSKQMFDDNSYAYETIMGGLEQKTDYAGPSFARLKERVEELQANQPESAFKMDGQITAGERDVADALTATPVATNEIVSQIHNTCNLKARMNEINPFQIE